MGKFVWKPLCTTICLPRWIRLLIAACGMLLNSCKRLCRAAGYWQELEHPVLHVDPERPNMLSGQLSVAPRWAIKLQVLGESPYCLIDLDNLPDTQRFGCTAAPSSGKRHKAVSSGRSAPQLRWAEFMIFPLCSVTKKPQKDPLALPI